QSVTTSLRAAPVLRCSQVALPRMFLGRRPASAEKVAGFRVETDVRDGHVLFEVADRGRARDQEHLWPPVEQPAQRHLGGCPGQGCGGGLDGRASLDWIAAAGEPGPEREERHESDAVGVARLEYGH